MSSLIHVKTFGMISELVGSDSFEMDNPGSSAGLRQRLYELYPALQTIKFTIAMDKKIISVDADISQGKEIALLPPFSGG
jgi:molybdopterin converting factor small subunit